MPVQLTESLEDYLEAIAELIAVEGHAHTKEIAEKLHVKMPSVTGALRQLEKNGCIVYKTNYPVVLTPLGKTLADEVIRRHGVLKTFFSRVLGMPVEQASETACRIEHDVDADTVRRFVLFSEAITARTDALAVRTYLAEAMALQDDPETADLRILSAFEPGDKAEIRRFGRNLHEKPCAGLKVGSVVTVHGPSLDGAALRIEQSGAVREIPRAAAENIWARLR